MTRIRATVLILALLAGVVASTTSCRKPAPEERLAEAIQLLQQNQTARGVMRLKEIVRDVPTDPAAGDARLLLARYYVTEGDAVRALDELRMVYETFPITDRRHGEAFEGLVAIRMQLQDYETVLDLYDEVIEAVGDDVSERETLQIRRAVIVAAIADDEDREEALELLKMAMIEFTEDFNRGYAREQLANIHRVDAEYEASSEVYRLYLEHYPEDPLASRLRMAMASNTIMAGEREKGLEEFEIAADQFREEFGAVLDKNERSSNQLDLAQLYQSIGEYEKAEKEMLAVMADNPMSRLAIETQFGIASMYTAAGVSQRDEELLTRGLDLYAQIARENPGTDIEAGAKRATEQSIMAFEQRMMQQQVAAEDSPTTEPVAQ